MDYLSAPFDVSIEVTSACNLKCIHCYANAGKETQNELTAQEWKRVIREIGEAKVFRVCISGGEPFCRNDLIDLLSYSNQFDFSIRITTNGTLINKNIASKLSKLENVHLIHISLDGGKPSTHDYIRGVRGSFRHVISGVKILKECGLNLIFGTILMKHNYKEIREIVDLANDFDVPVHFMQLMPAGRAKNKFEKLGLDSEELKEIDKILIDLAKTTKNVIWDNFCYRFSLEKELNLSQMEKMIAGCSAGKTECVVTSCGDIIPCDMFPRKPPYIAGNMRKQTFEQIWENAKIFHDLRAVTQESLNGKCFDCRFKSICVGGCRATALHEYGHFNTPDPLCPHDPEKDQRLIIQ